MSGRNDDVPGMPDSRRPGPLSAEGDTVDANPPMDAPVGPTYAEDEEPDSSDVTEHAKDE